MPVSALVRTRNRTVATRFAVAAVAALCAAALTGCGDRADDASSIVRTTTNIAGAGVVGLERDTTHACPLPSAPDQASGTRSVTHAAGVSEVPADPQRIVVLTTSALDATCALGLWERVVGAVAVDGPRPQPQYLGTGVLEIPVVGSAAEPDLAAIAGLRPDVIIGETPSGAATFDALRAIAPTVLVGSPTGWQAEFTAFAAGLGREQAAAAALRSYRDEARETGTAIAATESQASVVRFTADTKRVQGADSFAGGVLADAGVQRPAAQRGASFDVAAGRYQEQVEGDLIYVILAGEQGKEYGESVMRGREWKDLGAVSDHRVFAVEDSVWHGGGLTAARALLTDLRNTLNGFVTD
ncbi:iron-siderophore ABC transporter substrate-binding protein [Nocardia elegans]|uniref:ABC transporter substrate-binding protein n=1 Tax=Nocardia elegans TaxID=300029 RepID=UPI0018942FBB|nr:iron-siderophore ABC transporter substrate-binding protein [Nocardia elegans]MBF6247507.1 iron-siderophore ABC transporter substrate-binding protein [Nocardia elegans]